MAETSSSIVAQEVERFAAMAGDWWDPNGSSAMLHKLNPVRLSYTRPPTDQHGRAAAARARGAAAHAGPAAVLPTPKPGGRAYRPDQIDQHGSLDETGFRPLEGKSALDVGCG